MAARFPPDVALAVVAGLLSSAAAGLFLVFLAPTLGLVKVDFPYLLGRLWYPEGKLTLVGGWGLFLLGGVFWAFIYASYLHDRLPGPGWLQGCIYGVGLFLLTSLLVFPLMSLHPLVREQKLLAPGFFGLGLSGWKAALSNFLGHCLYGLLLGRIYRRKLIFFSS